MKKLAEEQNKSVSHLIKFYLKSSIVGKDFNLIDKFSTSINREKLIEELEKYSVTTKLIKETFSAGLKIQIWRFTKNGETMKEITINK